eukprot:12422044-Karenia_brevis.AAC.1
MRTREGVDRRRTKPGYNQSGYQLFLGDTIRLKGQGENWLQAAHRDCRVRWQNLPESERVQYNTRAAGIRGSRDDDPEDTPEMNSHFGIEGLHFLFANDVIHVPPPPEPPHPFPQ